MSEENEVAIQNRFEQGGESDFFLPVSRVTELVRDLRRVNASVAVSMDRIEILSPQNIHRSAEEQELTTANNIKDRIMLQLLQARATGSVSFPIHLLQYEGEEMHEYSHNMVTFHLPDPFMVDDEIEIFTIRARLHYLASVSEQDSSLTVKEAIFQGKPTYIEQQNTNGYVVRTLGEIADIEKDQQVFLQNGLFDRATELEYLRTRVAMRLLVLCATPPEDMTLRMRVGEIITDDQENERMIAIKILSGEEITTIQVNPKSDPTGELIKHLPKTPDFIEQAKSSLDVSEGAEELSIFIYSSLPPYPKLDEQRIIAKWRRNTVPVYRFSDPNEIYASSLETPWVRLLPQNLPRLVDEVLMGDEQATAIFFDYWQEKLVRFFSARTKEDYDDLAQMTLTRISNALPGFENRGEEGTFSGHLHSYCYAVARSTFGRYLDDNRKELRTSEFPEFERSRGDFHDEDGLEPDKGNEVTWDMFWGRVQEILPDQQWKIVDQLRKGLQNIEVMRGLGLELTEYRREIRNARGAIADQLLAPAGLKPIDSPEFSDLTTDTLKNAARVRSIDGIKILDRWYTTDSAFRMLLWKRSRSVPRPDTKVAPRQSVGFEGRAGEVYQVHKAQVREMAEQGLTIDEMAAKMSRHFNVVKRTLARMRKEGEVVIITRPRTPQQEKKDYTEFDQRVRSLRDRGMKNNDIVIELHTSIPSVTRAITRLQKEDKLSKRKPFGR